MNSLQTKSRIENFHEILLDPAQFIKALDICASFLQIYFQLRMTNQFIIPFDKIETAATFQQAATAT